MNFKLSTQSQLKLKTLIINQEDANPKDSDVDGEKEEEPTPTIVDLSGTIGTPCLEILARQNLGIIGRNPNLPKGNDDNDNTDNPTDSSDASENNNSGSSGGINGLRFHNKFRNYLQTQKLDLDIIFGGKDTLSSKDFLENFDSYLHSSNENIKKFAQMIKAAFEKFNCVNKYDQEDLLDALFSALNKAGHCGYKAISDDPGTGFIETIDLEKDAISYFNTHGGIFNAISNILENDEFYEDFVIGINGRIESYSQSNVTGDCWLLAGITALNSTNAGKSVINNAINWNRETHEITVTFKGATYPDGTGPVVITITEEEFVNARNERAFATGAIAVNDTSDTDFKAYSRGDNDVLLLELATEKLKNMIKDKEVIIPAGGIYAQKGDAYNPIITATAGQSITGGHQQQLLYFLTGNTQVLGVGESTVASYDKTLEILNQLYGHVGSSVTNNNDAYAAYFGLVGGESATLIDGTPYKYNGGSHAFAIVDMTSTTVTFMEPHDSEVTYTMTWEEFAKLGVRNLGATKVY